MSQLDLKIMSFLNGFAHQSPFFDNIMLFIMDSPVLKGGMVMGMLWWLWFRRDNRLSDNREIVIATIFASFIAMVVTKFIEHELPIIPRPIHNAGLKFIAPFGMSFGEGNDWWQSSFPSDHAALFFSLISGLWFVSNGLGITGYFYVLIIICLPRIYNGVHYPSDVFAGMVIGMTSCFILNAPRIRTRIAKPFLTFAETKPGIFYFIFFIFSYLTINLFGDIRILLRFLTKGLNGLF